MPPPPRNRPPARGALLDRLVRRVDPLPVLPATARAMHHYLNDEGRTPADLVELCLRDPALCAAVLREANAPYHGATGQIATPLHAALVVPIADLEEVLRGLTPLSRSAVRHRGAAYSQESLWQFSVATAEAAARLARIFQLRLVGVARVAGLFHDLGRLYLSTYHHDLFALLLSRARRRKSPVSELAKERLGLSLADLGAELAHRWRFPSVLTAAIAGADQVPAGGDHALLASIVHLAGFLVQSLPGSDRGEALPPRLEANAWNHLRRARPDLHESDFDRYRSELALAARRGAVA